ncbi:unnamed protein product [Pseudo-nitzschia multistriata]|uniref:Bestrophin homolog n=1 Tax=Pseudo-nitzschia multistriata TaxID=183589 RepID=A0A448ZFU3_9STRA|nr:unnamed protein product [Pseudo-nitzschia multistriata]
MSFRQTSYRRSAVSLWKVIFRLEGNIMFAVLPLCVINCLLLALVSYSREKFRLGFSPNGHGLLTLLVSFLVVSKVNLAYDRYRAVREYAGRGSTLLRELIQMAMAISIAHSNNNIENSEREKELRQWRLECVEKVKELLNSSVCVLQDRSLAKHFAYNKPVTKSGPSILTSSSSYDSRTVDLNGGSRDEDAETMLLDPLLQIQSLRLHLYCTPAMGFELLERVHLTNKLQEYATCYTSLLTLASTQLPFPLVQMGRAFLLIWTFSMPLVLLEGPFSDMWSAQTFLFFLTYGFIGLELVSIKLSDPFGSGRDDVPISGIRDAAIQGIDNDLREIAGMQATISERRLKFSRQTIRQRRHQSHAQETEAGDCQDHHHDDQNYGYHAMAGADNDIA